MVCQFLCLIGLLIILPIIVTARQSRALSRNLGSGPFHRAVATITTAPGACLNDRASPSIACLINSGLLAKEHISER